MEEKKVIIAMSGGVDSSVAALLCRDAGYKCIGITLKLFSNGEVGVSEGHTCCSLSDVEDARSVARSLGMPYYVLNFTDRFEKEVICRFVDAYRKGETPNPCIDCNRYIKFDSLYHRADELGFDFVATGHYARVCRHGDRYYLKKALDPSKDQSYVLYSLTQKQLARTVFPLGELSKDRVRALAARHGFINAAKHDSQDICFVPDGHYADFISYYTGENFPEGNFVDAHGNILGKHRGIIRYTVGQRKGLGLALKQPMYVSRICPETNTVVLSPEDGLYTKTVIVKDVNLISVDRIEEPVRLKAKVRYRQPEQWATVRQKKSGELEIVFDCGQRAVTRGQSAVLYDGDVVVGGGTVCDTF